MSMILLIILNLFADPRLGPYIESFKKDKLKYTGDSSLGSKINYKIEPINGGKKTILGRCIIWKNGRKDIIIDQVFFNLQLDCTIKLVMYHEMGHCILGKKHYKKDSIMLAKIDGLYSKFCKNQDYYIKKLFTERD